MSCARTRSFGADPGVVGESIPLDGESFQIVGIMPPDFEYYTPWTEGREIQLWTPLVEPEWSSRGSHWALAVGRLKPGVSWRKAEAEIRGIAARLQQEYPDTNARTTVWLQPFLILKE